MKLSDFAGFIAHRDQRSALSPGQIMLDAWRNGMLLAEPSPEPWLRFFIDEVQATDLELTEGGKIRLREDRVLAIAMRSEKKRLGVRQADQP